MKIISTIYKTENLNNLLEYADGIIVGNNTFSAHLTASFSFEEINMLIKETINNKKEIFLNLNQMFDDDKLKELNSNLDKIMLENITGIVVADLGAFQLLNKRGLAKKVIYNPETLLTNYYDFNFLAPNKILGAYIAKEITLNDILEITSKKAYKTFMVGHGHLSMFYSRRKLIDNFTTHINQENIYANKQNLTLTEEHRPDLNYPILEDQAGTHVFRPTVFNTLDVINELEKRLDYLIIDTIFKDDNYAIEVLKLYKNKEKNEHIINKLQTQYNEIWDDGFLNKKTIYKTKDQK